MAPDLPGATAEVDDPATADTTLTARSSVADVEPLPVDRPGRLRRTRARYPEDEEQEPSRSVLGPPLMPADAVPTMDPPMRKMRRGRRVKRVIRRIELWSVLKVALVFFTCMYAAVMGALVVIWGFAYSAGLVDNFESFANDIGFEHWQFYGEHMFRQAAAIGGVMVVTATVMTVLATALVNVISELTGGIRLVVIEEDVILVPADEAPPARRRNRTPAADSDGA